jgi:ribonucleoside-diphosphate reductase alpha chain
MGQEHNIDLGIQKWTGVDDRTLPMVANIIKKKYLLSNEICGHQENIGEFLDRIAGDMPAAKKLIEEGKFIPGGRILASRGLSKYGYKTTYSNCYVTEPPKDSIEEIYDACKRLARTFSYGGGIGIDISNLAPEGAIVRNSAKSSTGAVSFVDTFSQVAETIGQNNRRGALMISINDTHPDIEKFITHKMDLGKTSGANMSIRMSNDFFKAVEDNKYWTLSFTRKETGQKIEKKVKARDLLNKIAQTNYDYAEPGILYWDRVTSYTYMQDVKDFKYVGTNPCGEVPLISGGACLLGSMNLSKYWNDELHIFMYDDFEADVAIAIDYLNCIQNEGISLHPLKEQRNTASMWRQVGLGFMGLGDLFIKAHVRYGSNESIDFIHEIGSCMAFSAVRKSVSLAQDKGPFSVYNSSYYWNIVNSEWWLHNIRVNPKHSADEIYKLEQDLFTYGIRNSQLLACAPTGTLSTIFNISGGIEPIFALEYIRTTKSIDGHDSSYLVQPKVIREWLDKNGYENKSIADLKNDGVELPDYMVAARDIPWTDRLNVQAAWQKHIDSAISATINLPESTTVNEIADMYIYGYKVGVKGITAFRENCKRNAILNDTTSKKKTTEPTNKPDKLDKPKTIKVVKPAERKMLTRADFGATLNGTTYYKRNACGHLYITINHDSDGHPVEVFINSSKSGGCSANTEALGRMASTMLRSHIDINVIVDSIKGIKCAACSNLKGKGEHVDGTSCSDILANVIVEHAATHMPNSPKLEKLEKKKENNEVNKIESSSKSKSDNYTPRLNKLTAWVYSEHTTQENIDNGYCPECGSQLLFTEGCIKCLNCGFSKC